jgi:hypothetical protein
MTGNQLDANFKIPATALSEGIKDMRKTVLVVLTMALAPVCAFAVDGQVLINQSTLNAAGGTYTITQAGSYKLSGNLLVRDENTTAIVVTADNVTINLNGFSILGPTVCVGNPVACSPVGTGNGVDGGTHNSITVVNGNVRGMGHSGIFLGGNSSYGIFLGGYGGYVERVHADSNGYNGITVGIFSTVSGNTTNYNGAGPCCGSAGITVGGGSTVSSNTSNFNAYNGIVVFSSSTVIGNTATSNGGANLVAYGGTVVNNTAP